MDIKTSFYMIGYSHWKGFPLQSLAQFATLLCEGKKRHPFSIGETHRKRYSELPDPPCSLCKEAPIFKRRGTPKKINSDVG